MRKQGHKITKKHTLSKIHTKTKNKHTQHSHKQTQILKNTLKLPKNTKTQTNKHIETHTT